jgi:hypothetical protein
MISCVNSFGFGGTNLLKYKNDRIIEPGTVTSTYALVDKDCKNSLHVAPSYRINKKNLDVRVPLKCKNGRSKNEHRSFGVFSWNCRIDQSTVDDETSNNSAFVTLFRKKWK